MASTTCYGDDYERSFDPNTYLSMYHARPSGHLEGCNADGFFYYNCTHSFYSKTAGLTPNSARILEFGGGPTISYLISATPFASEIVFAEYSSVNRKAVAQWKNGEAGSHNWEPIFKYVVTSLEGESSPTASKKREEELKAKLSAIIPCDAQQEKPIGEGYDGSFDVVSSTLCLEAANKTAEQFKSSLQKLSRLLKPGGWLMLNGVTGESFYNVGEEKFFCLALDEDFILEALSEAGFSSVEIKRLPAVNRDQNPVDDCDGIFHASARLE
eukprot:m.215136 g.215136  ORF g.215136 m.215136 type:complete len:270 (+) comp39825_c1_seq2:214-1023(+)